MRKQPTLSQMLLKNGKEGAAHRILLAHGAGAPMDSAFMTQVAEGLAARGMFVVRFEFPYMARARSAQKRGAPDRMPTLERVFGEVLQSLGPAQEWMIGGKSMGGRVATHIADTWRVRAVVAFGYPFHPPRKPAALRTQHLGTLRTPCLILQGTRDALGSRDEVSGYSLSPSVRCAWLEDGDHSFEPRKSSGRTFALNLDVALDEVLTFAEQCRLAE